jgi:hypothetical protein
MAQRVNTTIAVIGVDIGKNSFHVVGLDQRGAIVLRQRWSRGQVKSRLANMPPCGQTRPLDDLRYRREQTSARHHRRSRKCQ